MAALQITDEEVKKLVSAATGDPTSLFGTGIHLAGSQYRLGIIEQTGQLRVESKQRNS